MDTLKLFCIDGQIIDIPRDAVTNERLEFQMLMPIENQPTMVKMLEGSGVELLTPMTATAAEDEFNG